MKKEGKFLALFILGIFMISFLAGVVSAIDGPMGQQVDRTKWYGKVFDFFGLGEIYGEVLVSLFIAMIIAAATYDILGLTAFESKPVKILIGIGLAGIVAVTQALREVSIFVFGMAGGVTIFSITAVIAIAAIAFFLIHVGVDTLAVRMISAKGNVDAERLRQAGKKASAYSRGLLEGQGYAH